MELTFGGIFIFTFISSGPRSVSGLVIKIGTFQILQQHPQLKKCAERVLFENEYVGCRVSEMTDQCQALTDAWEPNQITEKGYAYAKKVSVQEKFQPPLTVVSNYERGFLIWKTPVVLKTGSQIGIFISIPNWHLNKKGEEIFVLNLMNGSDILVGVEFTGYRIMKEKSILIEELVTNDSGGNTVLGDIKGSRLSALASPKEMFKMSFLAQPNAFTMFVDDEEVATLKLTTHIRKMRYIHAHKSDSSVDPIFAQSIKFIGVLE